MKKTYGTFLLILVLLVAALPTRVALAGSKSPHPTNSGGSAASDQVTPGTSNPEAPNQGEADYCTIPFGPNKGQKGHWGPNGACHPKTTPTPTPITPPPPVVTPTPKESGNNIPEEDEVASYCKEHVALAQAISETESVLGVWIYPVTRENGTPTVLPNRSLSTELLPSEFDYTHPSLDPAGSCREIVQAGFDYPELWVLNIDGTGAVQLLVNGEPIRGSQPDWGWNNNIVFVGGGNNLIKTDPTGSVYKPLGVIGTEPAISPSGQWVAYVSRNMLEIVSIDGAVFGQHSTEIGCSAPRWDPEGVAIICKQTVVGLSYILGKDTSLPIYQNGVSAVMDPTGDTLFSLLIETMGETWIVPNLLHLPSTGLIGQQMGHSEYGDWYTPNTLHPAEDRFVNQFP